MRIRDWHILTNGLVRFTTDDRFNVLYKEGSFNWILQVSNNSPSPHKGRTFLANFRGGKKKRGKYSAAGDISLFWLSGEAGTVPNVADVGNVLHARTPSLPTGRLFLTLLCVVRPYFSQSFMRSIFLHQRSTIPPFLSCKILGSS